MITTLILIGAAVIPVWNFAVMVSDLFLNWRQSRYNILAVIPFAAVTVSVLFGFLFLPLLRDMPLRKKNLFVSAGATLIFCALESSAEAIAVRLDTLYVVMTHRKMLTPDEITALARGVHFPPAVRIHYYIFSIILIVVVLNLLYSLDNTLHANGKHGKRFVILQGIATICYATAYVLVRVMQYEDYAAMRLTWGSVFNAAVCFTLAALAVGIYVSSFLDFKGRGKIVPSLLSVLTVLILYGAEYAMLDGEFYSYGENIMVALLIRFLIIIIPGAFVYLLLQFSIS